MPKFRVGVRAVSVTNYLVQAESEEQAKEYWVKGSYDDTTSFDQEVISVEEITE